MPLAVGSQTVLVFKHLQFRGDWTRFNGANAIIYTAGAPAELIAVVEDRAGNDVTYWFKLNPNDDVWVTYSGDAEAHIPALCAQSAPGDDIRCRG